MTRQLSLNALTSPTTALVQDHSHQCTPHPPPSSPHRPFSVRSLRDPMRTKILSLLCSKSSHAAHLTQSRWRHHRPCGTWAHHLSNHTPHSPPQVLPSAHTGLLDTPQMHSCLRASALAPLSERLLPQCLYRPLPHLLEVFAQMSLSQSVTPGPY